VLLSRREKGQGLLTVPQAYLEIRVWKQNFILGSNAYVFSKLARLKRGKSSTSNFHEERKHDMVRVE